MHPVLKCRSKIERISETPRVKWEREDMIRHSGDSSSRPRGWIKQQAISPEMFHLHTLIVHSQAGRNKVGWRDGDLPPVTMQRRRNVGNWTCRPRHNRARRYRRFELIFDGVTMRRRWWEWWCCRVSNQRGNPTTEGVDLPKSVCVS